MNGIVKELSWRERHSPPMRDGDLVSDSVVGTYTIRPSSSGKRFRLWLPGMAYDKAGVHLTVESAQKDAQAHFDAAILSALPVDLRSLKDENATKDRRIAELEAALKQASGCLDGEPVYHHEGMGCGLEDRNITDRYDAMHHGWECALERVYGEHLNWARDITDAALRNTEAGNDA